MHAIVRQTRTPTLPPWPRGLELILLAPAAALTAAGAMAWSAHFWLGHRLQVVADLAARAGGQAINEEAVEQAARSVAVRELVRAGLPPAAMAVFVERRGGRLTLHLAYDAGRPTGAELSTLLPTPPATIVKRSAVKLVDG